MTCRALVVLVKLEMPLWMQIHPCMSAIQIPHCGPPESVDLSWMAQLPGDPRFYVGWSSRQSLFKPATFPLRTVALHLPNVKTNVTYGEKYEVDARDIAMSDTWTRQGFLEKELYAVS